MMSRVYVSLGSNIDRTRNVRSAISILKQHYKTLKTSSVYESESIGFKGLPFYNLVVSFETDSTVTALIEHLKNIEDMCGRIRGPDRFVDRTLDLDVVIFGDYVSDDENVDVPSADILEYAFVLRPLAEMAPQLVHPSHGVSMQHLWNEFDAASQPLELVDICLP